MKKEIKNNLKFHYGIIGLLLLLVSSCEKIAIPHGETVASYDQVYMSAAARNPFMVTLKMADSVYHFTYGASFGGYGTPAQDIVVNFMVDAPKATTYNAATGKNYPLLPADAYEFTQSSAVIKKGTVNTAPLSININPTGKLELFKEYILPVTITGVSEGIKLNPNLTTAYYIVKASLDFSDFPNIDRSEWQVTSVSSEEPAEGETNGGLGIHVIDNKTSTFWHSKWDGGEAPLPHWLVVDMGQPYLLHGLSFTGRQSSNSGKPNSVGVQLSDDGLTWEDAGMLSLQNVNSQQKFFLSSFKEKRYFRINILSTYGGTQFSHLAELGAF